MRLGTRLLLLSVFLHACGVEGEGEGDDDTMPVADAGDVPPADGALPDATTNPRDATTNPRDATVYVPRAECGDAKRADSEECDDGDTEDGDGCDATCHKEAGFNCPQTEGACAAVCGDELVVFGEQCDDGDADGSDGCSEACIMEPGWSCVMSGADCVAAACGDGLLAGGELCDDGNALPGDGCSGACVVEDGWLCAVADQSCTAAKCGDGIRAGMEACDDGFAGVGDGCTAACDAVEPNFSCPDTGGMCTRTSVCGNGLLTSDEECDDRNKTSGDGCSSLCKLEPGWQCSSIGSACTAARCEDGVIAGSEQCEDGNAVAGDGCTDCQVDSGWACEWSANQSTCHAAECQDGRTEGNEGCDDDNDIVGDGCSPTCLVEPRCEIGQPCRSTCGDGIRLPSDLTEECDDGNLRDDDGCSHECKIENGFSCRNVTAELPASFPLTVVYRDFIARPLNGATRHPDYERFSGSGSIGMVGDELVAGKPKYTGFCQEGKSPMPSTCQGGAQSTTEANFDEWYGNTPLPAKVKKVVTTINMTRVSGTANYQNPTFGSSLFPLDGQGWVAVPALPALPQESASNGHNFGFSSEIHHWFEFTGGEILTFSGDDDVWVFIGGKLALDLGGLHSRLSRTIQISSTGVVSCYIGNAVKATADCGTRSLGLTPGNVYEMALFHAERHTDASNFDLTLNGFVAPRSVCESKCGDGVVTRGEACDEGSFCVGGSNADMTCSAPAGCPGGTCASRNDGSYGRCNASCSDFGPHCGDKLLQSEQGEQCDNGVELNRGGYNGCTQECKNGPRCGDSKVDGMYSEQCDQGTVANVGGYDGCSATCRLSERCGDGMLQAEAGEQCDDGVNRGVYGGCAPGCKLAPRCGDGMVDRANEQCDQGTALNDGRYGGCKADCRKGPRCGDRIIDAAAEETCDDGNVNDYDGCSHECRSEIVF